MWCKRSSWRNKIFSSVAFLGLSALFLFHTWDSMKKFASERTTMAMSYKFQKNKEIRIGRAPHVTFCPGLRTSALRSLTRKTFASPERAEDLPTYFDMYPDVNVTTEEAIMNWWERNLTFSQNETFLLHESRGMSLESLQMQSLSTPLGVCYAAEKGLSYTGTSVFALNMTDKISVSMYVYKKSGHLGLNGNYWLTPTVFKELLPGKSYDVSLSTVIYKNLWEGHLCGEDLERDMTEWRYIACVSKWLEETFLEAMMAECPRACRIPPSDVLTHESEYLRSLPLCTSRVEYECVRGVYVDTYERQDDVYATGCKKPCVKKELNAHFKLNPYLRDDVTLVYAFYESTNPVVYEEYRLFDLNAIVAAVGGSLGLFLGFSCWHFVLSGLMHVNKICDAKKGAATTDAILPPSSQSHTV